MQGRDERNVMEMSALGGLHLYKQVHHDDKGLITVTITKYNPMNDGSEDTLLCSEVVIITIALNPK
jgi:hypothetical protein